MLFRIRRAYLSETAGAARLNPARIDGERTESYQSLHGGQGDFGATRDGTRCQGPLGPDDTEPAERDIPIRLSDWRRLCQQLKNRKPSRSLAASLQKLVSWSWRITPVSRSPRCRLSAAACVKQAVR